MKRGRSDQSNGEEPAIKEKPSVIAPPQDDIATVIAEYKPRCQAALEKFLPRKFDDTSMKNFFGEPLYGFDNVSSTEALLTPIWDLLDRGGKQWRPILLCLVTEALGGKEELLLPISVLCEIVHNGTLMSDDVEDDSKLRRGKECIHLLYGVDVSINTGCAMYFLPFQIFRDYRKNGLVSDSMLLKCYELYGQELTNVHLGQGLDILWHKGTGNPSVQDYLQMCAYKTGVLARLSARLSALLSGANDEFIKHVGIFAESIGVAFQIQDDLLNLNGTEFSQQIAYPGEDIHEGKRSLMVIHCLANAPPAKADRLKEILNKQTNDQKEIQEAIAIIRSTDSMAYAEKVAQEIITKAWNNIEPLLPENPAKYKLKVFADYLICRKK